MKLLAGLLALTAIHLSCSVREFHDTKKCEKRQKTRAAQSNCDNNNPLFKADRRTARVAGIEEGSMLCLKHKNEAKKTDNRCSFPVATQHTSTLVLLPERHYEAVDRLGREQTCNYKPGTKWCTGCRKNGERISQEKVPELYIPPTKRKVIVYFYFLLM
ncbi:MAG: hypothetical protein DSY43_05465 [Gammaproteobacteria bacterium]|nr:MAG: hypothetical protein DSY43_05465 [Gammaproteobacteria bacterium]